MEKFKLKKALGENGLSLVEVLASFVILTLLLTTFLMMFIQSAKVNKASEHIIDATYIAQTEMENMYALSTTTKNGAKEATIKGLGYTNGLVENGWIVFGKEYNSGILIKIKLQNKKGNMDRVLVEVRGIPDDNLQAQMENVVVWRAD
ncbi:hypothetical protein MKY15_16105 [Sporosarcina sp. FSL K6-1540]|uniref:hypothetical protein n=1 Tax=Sporosarcina sp. FSL K6-1540 TaxID=2921555 RepID=UPI003159BD5E